MLRIPLPEDDGFALTLPEDNQAPTGRTTAPQGAAHQFPVRSRCSLLVASGQFGGYAANSSFVNRNSQLV